MNDSRERSSSRTEVTRHFKPHSIIMLETNLDLKTNCSCWHVSLFSYSVEWAFLQIKLSCSLSETSADLGFMLPSIRQWCLFLRHSPLVFPDAFHKGWAQLCRKILIFPETGKNWPKCCQSRDLKICWKFWPLAFAEDSMFFRKIFRNIRTGDAWINPFSSCLILLWNKRFGKAKKYALQGILKNILKHANLLKIMWRFFPCGIFQNSYYFKSVVVVNLKLKITSMRVDGEHMSENRGQYFA